MLWSASEARDLMKSSSSVSQWLSVCNGLCCSDDGGTSRSTDTRATRANGMNPVSEPCVSLAWARIPCVCISKLNEAEDLISELSNAASAHLWSSSTWTIKVIVGPSRRLDGASRCADPGLLTVGKLYSIKPRKCPNSLWSGDTLVVMVLRQNQGPGQVKNHNARW